MATNFQMTFAQRTVSFYNSLDLQLPDSLETQVLNPYKNQEVKKCVADFCSKYFSDEKKRIFILGINPGRFGSGLTGISFTDPVALREYCGIKNNFGNKRELSSEFIYKMIEAYGGVKKFYTDFFISAVCPLGFMKSPTPALPKGEGVRNYNYYDDKKLQNAVLPFIKRTFKQQIEIGASNKALIVIGADKNRKFVETLNEETKYFKKIIALDHPRFIMQYRRKKVDAYIEQYLLAFSEINF
ncbi:MAG: DUF4918 family protein [Chitinophagales bacterium]|nr:DUF4918 family protein [Chitinophagales bacterium]